MIGERQWHTAWMVRKDGYADGVLCCCAKGEDHTETNMYNVLFD